MDIGLTLVVCGTIIAGCACRAGATWGRAHQCLMGFVIRALGGLVLYSLAGYLMYSGVVLVAQTFSRDSQTNGMRQRADDSSATRQQQFEQLYAYMHAQEVINAQHVSVIAGLERRLQRIEDVKPETVPYQLATLIEVSRDNRKSIDSMQWWFIGLAGTLITLNLSAYFRDRKAGK